MREPSITIKPLGDHVVVVPDEGETVTKSGIIIPETVDKKVPHEGTIIAAGEGETMKDGSKKAMEVKVGDKILYPSWGGNDVTLKDKEGKKLQIKILHAESILGTVS